MQMVAVVALNTRVQGARLSVPFPLDLPPLASLRQHSCHSNQPPRWLGHEGFIGASAPFLVPLADPRVQIQEQQSAPDRLLLACSLLFGSPMFPRSFDTFMVTRTSDPFLPANVSGASDVVSIMTWSIKEQK